jgi:hypothetical protein
MNRIVNSDNSPIVIKDIVVFYVLLATVWVFIAVFAISSATFTAKEISWASAENNTIPIKPMKIAAIDIVTDIIDWSSPYL